MLYLYKHGNRTSNNISSQVVVPPELFDEMEQKWAPPNDPVFELTPPAFQEQADTLYEGLGRPAVTSETFWIVYTQLLFAFRNQAQTPELAVALSNTSADKDFVAEMPLIPGLQDLRHGGDVVGKHGYVYLGGLDKPPTQGQDDEEDLREFADFSDVENSDDEDED